MAGRKKTWEYNIKLETGHFYAKIDNARQGRFSKIPPTLRIVKWNGNGLMDWEDWYFTQANHVKTLKANLAKFCDCKLKELEEFRVK